MAAHRKKTGEVKAAEGAENIQATATDATPEPGPIHSFSRTIAEAHGEKAAVILQYLAHHVAKSKHVYGGKRWFYKTLDDLAAQFPYIKRSTIHDTLKSLKDKGVLQIGDYNKKGFDRTCWYAFADDNVRKQAQSSKPVYFRVQDAVKYGIVAAVLLGNLEYWIRENRKEDPSYTWHSMSPRELAKHLPFPKTTLQRALAELVAAKVINAKECEVKGGAAQYTFVDPKRLNIKIRGGPISDMGGGSIPDEGGPVSDMGDPKSDMPGPNPDMGGPNPDNNTILIENPLKEPSLKEPSYVEPSLPTTVSNSLPPDKLKQVKDVHPFAKPVFKSGKGPGSEKSQQSQKSQQSKLSDTSRDGLPTVSGTGPLHNSGKSANLQKSSLSEPGTELMALSSSGSSIPTSPATPPTSESDHFALGPRSRTRVKLSKSLESTFFTYSKIISEAGENGLLPVNVALTWVSTFLQQTKPEELVEVLKITDQKALHHKLADLFTPHLAKYLEPLLEDQKELAKAELVSKLVMQFLTQGFCRYGDDLYYPLGTRHPDTVSRMLYEKLQPYFDAREEEQRKELKDSQQGILKARSQQYQSPDKARETRSDVSAAQKVQVLRNALISINNIGAFDDKNQLKLQVVEYNNRTFDAASQFLQANPDFTVAHLIAVLGKCLELPKERDFREEGNDPLWHARKGRDISFLIQHLDVIVQSLNCVDEIGPFQPLPPGTLSRKSMKSSKPTETDDD